MKLKLKDCFNNEGNLKFDPYRLNAIPIEIAMNDLVFEDGYLRDMQELEKLIDGNPQWHWTCSAVGLYHAQILACATKNNYSTIFYFR